MENRCSDIRMAMPSVYGRTSDTVGNSIPGFTNEWKSSSLSSSFTNADAAADIGGLPSYEFTSGRSK